MIQLVKAEDVVTHASMFIRADPWLRLLLEALSKPEAQWELPTRVQVEEFVRENPKADLQAVLADGGECTEDQAWFFARREGRTDFDEAWFVSRRLGPLPWLLKSRDAT